MLYLQASEQIEFLDQWEGKTGRFAKVFAINDKRNKNGWRVTWASIKKNIASFDGMPAIEYTKCEGSICDLDHTDGSTYEQSLDVQEPFRIASIIDFVLDEDKHTAYFILEFSDEGVYERVKAGQLKFVSPSIWPSHGGIERLGEMENGLPMLDVFHWRGLHTAFVNNPAFGEEARVRATCEGGADCQMRLLTAAVAASISPIMVRHGGHLTYVSVSEDQAKEISALASVNESEVLPILRANTSFTSCACNSAHKMADKKPEEIIADLKAANEQLTAKNNELAAKLEKSDQSLKAKEQELEANKAQKAKADGESDQVKDLMAQIAQLASEAKQPFIAKMVAARKAKGADEESIRKFEDSLKAKSLEDVKGQYANEEILIKDLSAKQEGEAEQLHVPFNGGEESSALSGKSLEEVLGEGA